MAIAKCSNCPRKFRQNEQTGDLCRECRWLQREGDREGGAAERMTIAVFGTNDPDVLAEQDKERDVA